MGFDDMVMGMFRRIVAHDLEACARLQVVFPTCQGRTGLVPAGDLVAAAFVAARIESQPVATSLFRVLVEVSGGAHAFLADCAASMAAAHATLFTQVGEDRGAQVEDVVHRGARGAAARFAALQASRHLPGFGRDGRGAAGHGGLHHFARTWSCHVCNCRHFAQIWSCHVRNCKMRCHVTGVLVVQVFGFAPRFGQ